MLSLPFDTQDPSDFADWVEMNVLVGKAGQASLDNLRTALKASSLYARNQTPEQRTIQLEGIIARVGNELKSRSELTKDAYPFRMVGSSLERRRKRGAGLRSTYAFCLMLSYLPWNEKRLSGHFPDRTFEEIACLAAGKYLGGSSIRFGWPRVASRLPKGFGAAVEELSKRVAEGEGYRPLEETGAERDGGLDVVAWRAVDSRSGKLLLFGGCATGEDWRSKLTELQPMDFCQLYFQGSVSPLPTKAFFTPRIVPVGSWKNYSQRAGLIFDRCRVSAYVPELPQLKYHGNVSEWMQTTIGSTGKKADRRVS